MAKCLVTGHKGYIGSHLYAKLQELGHEVMGIDQKDGHDICKELEERSDGSFHPHWYNFQPEYIFHMACWPRIGLCLEKPVETMKNNVMAGSIILSFARKCKSVRRVIYSSSSSVVGDGDGPTNPYALQKLATEIETRLYAEVFDVDTVSLRYFNVYSETQNTGGPYATAVAHWRNNLMNGVDPYITGDGEQRRDMVHVEDVVSANIFCMEPIQQFGGRVFDVGTGNNISLNEIKDIILEIDDSVNFNYVEARPGEVKETRANTEPLKRLGWEASISIEEGIRKCFQFGGDK